MRMNDSYFAGLFDGEGTGCILFTEQRGKPNRWDYRYGIQAQMNLSISLNYGKEALSLIHDKYGGNLSHCVDGRDSWQTRRPDVIKRLVPILLKNCIVKRETLLKLQYEVIPIFERREHVTEQGLRKLIRLQKQLNHVSEKTRHNRKNWENILNEKVKEVNESA